ncbi:transcription antitermination factor NusB [Streptomyces spiralis]|uniref:transcription antitermination factor NusB n=1 Tax=Streptomyces spiralis TaxID=66376 RepID=UPI0033DF2D32
MSDTPRRPRRPAKPYRRPQKDPVRILAFEALRAVDERDAYANLVLPPLLRKAREKEGPEKFDGRDAALATELVYGTLRRQGTYDVASERQPHRAGLVAKALAGNPGPYQVIAADGTRPAWRPGSFDRVLVDVPCTGLGALRRRPEARWRRRPEDLDGFAPLQRGLLRTALESVRVGGVVGYATCSPHLAETRAVVADVLKQFPEADLIDARPLLPDVPALGDGPDVQLWPHLHGTDAMYLALIRRTG